MYVFFFSNCNIETEKFVLLPVLVGSIRSVLSIGDRDLNVQLHSISTDKKKLHFNSAYFQNQPLYSTPPLHFKKKYKKACVENNFHVNAKYSKKVSLASSGKYFRLCNKPFDK